MVDRSIKDGRITIPKKFREHLEVKEGSIFEVYLYGEKLLLEVLAK